MGVKYTKDGTVKDYGRPINSGDGTEYTTKILHCIEAIENGANPVCTAKTARPHVKMIGDIYKNIPIVNFPEEEKVYLEYRLYVPGLREKMLEAYEKTCMLSEL